MHWHWQNLRKDYPADKRDKSLVHGRAWWYFNEKSGNPSLSCEWVIGSKRFDLGFEISKSLLSEHTMHFTFAIPPISFYWDFTWSWLENTRLWNKIIMYNKFSERYGDGKQFSFRIFEWAIWGEFCANDGNSSSKDPWWMRWSINIPDLLFGRNKYSEKIIREENIKIPMPEKEYDAHAKLMIATWKRPRWISQHMSRVEIEVPEGIPHPGKGTCSYNCDDDALFGLTCEASSINEGICKVIESVTKCRLTYPL